MVNLYSLTHSLSLVQEFMSLVFLGVHFAAFRPKFADPQRSKDERDDIDNYGYRGPSGAGWFILPLNSIYIYCIST